MIMADTVSSLSVADTRTYTISELAREFGVTPRALRFYEDKDMLHPARDGMMRVYSNRDRARLKIILQCKRVGLPLADIREILDLYAMDDGQRSQMREALNKFQMQSERLQRQREDIESAIGELTRGIVWLEQQLERIGPGNEGAERVAAYEKVARERLENS
jgi:DNA-binding transcriptional MerR regulator